MSIIPQKTLTLIKKREKLQTLLILKDVIKNEPFETVILRLNTEISMLQIDLSKGD